MNTLINTQQDLFRGKVHLNHMDLKIFTTKDLTINSNSGRMAYHRRDNDKNSLHWRQRKLLLSEIEFFTYYWDMKNIPSPVCVYAGTPGTHIFLLSEMYPSFTFHLYDSSKFVVEPVEGKIKIFNEYFTDEVAARYANRNDVFFISDIRTADYKSLQREAYTKRGIDTFDKDGTPIGPFDMINDALKEAEIKNEDQIWDDMLKQQKWVFIMNPEHVLLKFRLPYIIDGIDQIVPYLEGVVYWQVWPSQNSTETRLKPVRNKEGIYELGTWSSLEYEEWCFHHNVIDREQISYINILTNDNQPISYPELLNDYDSVAEAMILKLYLEKMGISDVDTLYEKVEHISKLITLSLNHYQPDIGTLASKRDSIVKSTNKVTVDAFRNKR